MTISQVSTESGLSVSLLHKLWHEGRGPKRTHVTKKKIVIKRADYEVWLKHLGETENA